MKKGISILVVVGIIIAAYYGGLFKSDEQKIEDRMNAFLSAYNTGDMDKVLESLDAKTRNTYQAAMNLGNALIGMSGFQINISDMFSLGIGLSPGQVLQFKDMEICIKSDTKATVSTIMYYQDIESSYNEKVVFTLVKEGNDWYICG